MKEGERRRQGTEWKEEVEYGKEGGKKERQTAWWDCL